MLELVQAAIKHFKPPTSNAVDWVSAPPMARGRQNVASRGADAEPIAVELVNAPPFSQLRAQWLDLEACSEGSFFISWSWVSSWLQGMDPQVRPLLLRARRGSEVVGLALWAPHVGRRLRVLPTRCLHLHATGNPDQDLITIEHNGFLVHREGSAQIKAAMFDGLLRETQHIDVLRMPGLAPSAAMLGSLQKGRVLSTESRPSYNIDLAEVRRRDGNYVALLSSNTRQQIRRSIKAYEGLGELSLTEAPDLSTAIDYLASLAALNRKRWASESDAGIFSRPHFAEFHRRLIGAAFADGHIQMLRVRAGRHDVGYLYNFVHRGRVLFYQSGFDYELLAAQGRPGLVAHALSVQHNARQGHAVYDFLAGAARYKESLSTSRQPMVWAAVYRTTPAFRLEQALRSVKRRVRSAVASLTQTTSA